MDRTLPVEVMLCGMEEIQMFLLENPDEECKLTEVLMISHALNKMVKTGLYGKAIEQWNNLCHFPCYHNFETRIFFSHNIPKTPVTFQTSIHHPT